MPTAIAGTRPGDRTCILVAALVLAALGPPLTVGAPAAATPTNRESAHTASASGATLARRGRLVRDEVRYGDQDPSQRRAHLAVTGVADRATWRRLNLTTVRGRRHLPAACSDGSGWDACHDRARHEVTLWRRESVQGWSR